MSEVNQGRRSSDRAVRRALADQREYWVLAILILTGVALAGGFFWRTSNSEFVHDGAPSWSPDGQQIAFAVELEKPVATAHEKQSDLFVMRADGTDRRQLTWTPAEDGAPAFSPDGKQIAFETNRDGDFEIYVTDLSGGNTRRVTHDRATDRSPSWSPDGQRLLFLSDRDRRPEFDVYETDLGGIEVRRLTTTGQNWAPQYSPSGRKIAVQTVRDIHLLDPHDGTRQRLTFDPQNGMAPSWSPDGARLAFTSTRNGRLELFTMTADGSDQQLLVSMPGASAMEPHWSPDGARVAFVYVPGDEENGTRTDQPYAIFVVELATRKVKRLSP